MFKEKMDCHLICVHHLHFVQVISELYFLVHILQLNEDLYPTLSIARYHFKQPHHLFHLSLSSSVLCLLSFKVNNACPITFCVISVESVLYPQLPSSICVNEQQLLNQLKCHVRDVGQTRSGPGLIAYPEPLLHVFAKVIEFRSPSVLSFSQSYPPSSLTLFP